MDRVVREVVLVGDDHRAPGESSPLARRVGEVLRSELIGGVELYPRGAVATLRGERIRPMQRMSAAREVSLDERGSGGLRVRWGAALGGGGGDGLDHESVAGRSAVVDGRRGSGRRGGGCRDLRENRRVGTEEDVVSDLDVIPRGGHCIGRAGSGDGVLTREGGCQ